ncbi:MAG: NADH-ubiquinone oxidoreductase-F iron-sulfur binding region domain-containing protein [Actinomycetota bacterium]
MNRVLPERAYETLDDYVAAGGGRGLEAARAVAPEVVIAEIEASGLRGRGGAGFPTGTKWRTVRDHRSDLLPTSVVVNAAEGEPGTFKDRTIMRLDPYSVLEGALVAAHAVGAAIVVVATKATFSPEVARLRRAMAEVRRAGWLAEDFELSLHEGPSEYLYGEETALLESIAGRPPFPRIAPPFRRGVTEVVELDADDESGLAAPVDMAGPSDGDVAPPTLVDNVETLANVPRTVSEGAAWFRRYGTDESPGTIVCTVTGSVRRPGVGEVPMGTPLAEAIAAIAGGPLDGRRLVAVLPGVANGYVPADLLATPLTYEAMAANGSGLGSASFRALDDGDDVVAVTAGASRFLAVESCGQCVPCKQDGLTLATILERLCRGEPEPGDVDVLKTRAATVGDRARCYLALQHQAVVTSLLDRFPDHVEAHATHEAPPTDRALVAELVDLGDGHAAIDEDFRHKQPDWDHGRTDSGQAPADRHAEHRS